MRIAIPIADGKLAMHFGHCAEFALLDMDTEKGTVIGEETIEAPAHEPGLLPRWLAERDVNAIIAGGMGRRAQGLFAEQNILVVVGAPADEPETLALAYVNGDLESGSNLCDH